MRRARVMLTGAGGAAAVSFIKAVRDEPVDIYAADMDAFGAGLYLVPAERRHLIPAGASPSFVPLVLEYCRAHSIDVLVPTVDAELMGVARARDEFAAAGVTLLLASKETLALCLDKLSLLDACDGAVPVGRHAALDETFSPAGWEFPLIVKPRSGSGSRGIQVVHSAAALELIARDERLLVQEYLAGEEYSVDVLARSDGVVIAAVPRLRMKIDSGIAVTARTLHDTELQEFGRRVAARIGLTYTANIQFRRDAHGTPTLLEVNARFPGTMPLTVRSGVNMPLLSLRDVLGHPPDDTQLPFEDIAVVRYWTEEFIGPDEIDALQAGVAGSVPETPTPVRKDVASLAPGYLAARRKNVESIRVLVESGDYSGIALLGHNMKGSGAGYGFAGITTLGRELEDAAKAKDAVAIRRWNGELEAYLSRIVVPSSGI